MHDVRVGNLSLIDLHASIVSFFDVLDRNNVHLVMYYDYMSLRIL
jgi:hypothetical protein